MIATRKVAWLIVSILLTLNTAPLLAQTQNSVGGSANGGSANVTATVAGINASATVLPVAPVNLPPQGGSFTNQVASVFAELSAPGVLTVMSTGAVVNTTSGSVTQSSAHAESSSTVNNVNLLNGFVTAAMICSQSSSDGNGASASSSAAGSLANSLRIAGTLYEQSEFAPNTRVSASATIQANVNGLPVLVPVTGTVIINEQIGGGNGTTTSSLTVNFLHVTVSGSVAGSISLNANIVVASASSSVNFAAPPPPTNHPPALSVPGPQTVQAGTTLNFGVTATDPDAGDSVTISASNVPPHAGFSQTSGNPASGQFSFTPDSSQVGTITVGFTATDNHGASTPGSVQITVTNSPPPPTNHPPTLNLPGPQVVQVGANLRFSVSASDQDAGDTVTLNASNIPTGASVTPNPSTGNPANGQVSFTPASSQAGQTFTINFSATDNHGAGASGSVQITVTSSPPVNHPPIISVPGPQTIEVGKLLAFTVTASDPDGDAVILSAGNLPANASFNAATGGFSFTPSSAQAGLTLIVAFTATDTAGASASASVPITVTASTGGGLLGPPIISVPPSPIIIEVGKTLTFMVSATSPVPNCSVSISASGLPAHAGFDASNQRFSFTPSQDQKDRSFVVTFTATDCAGQTATATVTIIVISPDISGINAGRICVPVTKIFFDTAPVDGSCGFVTVSLTNAGAGTLRITSLALADGTHFRVEAPGNVPMLLQSAGVMEIKIMFQPKSRGTQFDTLTINTDDPNQPTMTIVLKGKGGQ
jgi:hypothetical protein